jgi:alpha-tubulin suppressor-like RCC1 family protein
LGTFYLGGNRTKLHSLYSEHLKPYKDHLDIKMINFAKHSMILLLKTGQVYGLGRNKYRHFVDHEPSRHLEHEQLIPFFDSKDKIESIESYKRVTVAVTRNGKIYAVGDKLKKILKIKDERFGFFALPLTQEAALVAAEAGREPSSAGGGEGDGANESQEADKKEKAAKADSRLQAKKSWISRCKSSGNFVIYCLMEDTEAQELGIYSIGKNTGGCLLGLGADEQEALYFKKLSFKDPGDPDGKKELKIASVDGVDIRCGQHHTIFGLNDNEHVYVIGCYNRSSQAQEEIISVPTLLGLCSQYKVQKFDTEKNKTVIVAEKKDSGTVQVLVGQFAPLVKEESFKTAQLELDLSGKTTPTKVSQIYVRDNSAYISTSGSFRIDPYDQLSTTVKTGFAA